MAAYEPEVDLIGYADAWTYQPEVHGREGAQQNTIEYILIISYYSLSI